MVTPVPRPPKTLPELLQPVNRMLTPWLELGWGNPPPCLGGGLVLLEVRGRRSGLPRRLPLLATVAGRRLLVSTVRQRANWLRNLRAAGSAQVWLQGRRRRVVLERLLDAGPGNNLQVAVLRIQSEAGEPSGHPHQAAPKDPPRAVTASG